MKANNSNKTNEIKKIFSKRLARELRYKPEFNVYLFKDTESLRKTLSEITQKI